MTVTPQLLRIIKEEIENLDYGTIKITINKNGSYTEIASEKKIRVIKNAENENTTDFHRG